MRILKSLIYSGTFALLLSACGSSVENPIDAFGEAESVVVALDGSMLADVDKMAKNGMTFIVDDSNQLLSTLRTVNSLKGLDITTLALKHNMIVAAIAHDSDLRESLKVEGLAESRSDNADYAVFVPRNSGVFYIVGKEYLSVVYASSAEKALEAVLETARNAQTPMPEWRHKLLENNDSRLRGFARYEDGRGITFNSDISTDKAHLYIYNVDWTAGSSLNWLPDGKYTTVGALKGYLDDNAQVSLAIAPCDFGALGRPLSQLRALGITEDFMDALSHTVSGPVWGNAYFNGDDMLELDKLAVSATVTASSKTMGTGMLMGLYGMLENNGIPAKYDSQSKTVATDIMGARMRVTLNDNILRLTTDYQPSAKAVQPDSAAQCLAWARLNLTPAIMQFFAGQAGGLKVEIKLLPSSATVEAQTTDGLKFYE